MKTRKNKIERGEKISISHDNVVRAARLLSPTYFPSLQGDKRKIAVLTLKRGFVPMVDNSCRAINAICSMCSEAQGKDYNPLRCLKTCPMMAAASHAEKLSSALTLALAKFLPKEGDEGGKTVKGKRKTGKVKGGDDGEDDRKSPVLA